MVANADLIEDPAPTDAQIREFFDFLNRGKIDRYLMQQILSLCRTHNIDSSPRYDIVDGQNNNSPDHVIDLDAEPFIPEGWSIRPEDQIASRARGMWRFDPGQVILYLTDEQCQSVMNGNTLRSELTNRSILPANVLDYLLAHQELIPESWKRNRHGNNICRQICFWGTIYRRSDGSISVRYLYFSGEWYWDSVWLIFGFGSSRPSALLTA